jgi:hypothetical protein
MRGYYCTITTYMFTNLFIYVADSEMAGIFPFDLKRIKNKVVLMRDTRIVHWQ